MARVERFFIPPQHDDNANIHRRYAAEAGVWVWLPGSWDRMAQSARFENRFRVDAATETVIHVSADHRYVLALDGTTISRGPHRSDVNHWAFASYRLTLEPGEHVLSALVHWMGDHAPLAQLDWRPGFLFAAEGPLGAALDTGRGAWRVRRLPGVSFSARYDHSAAGAEFVDFAGHPACLDGRVPLGEEVAPVPVRAPFPDHDPLGQGLPGWRLHPSPLPDLLDEPVRGGRVRAIVPGGLAYDAPLSAEAEFHPDRSAWQALLDGDAPVTVPAGATVSCVVDWTEYHAAYSAATLDGAPGARLSVAWSEAFSVPGGAVYEKGDRDVVTGKRYLGVGLDEFIHGHAEGEGPRDYEAPWWRAGRYVVLTLSAPPEGPAVLRAFAPRATRYPHRVEAELAAGPAVDPLLPFLWRGLLMCTHETYTDCPHYEQLHYIGDTRLTLLLTYIMTTDDRLARRSIELFGWSRGADGLARERYPSRVWQRSSTYGLLWPALVADYAQWRDDPDWVRARMRDVRGTLEGGLALLADDGLLGPLTGWSFVDWVPGWNKGRPPDGDRGSLVNLHLLLALRAGAALERGFGESVMAERWAAHAERLARRIVETFWVEERSLLADDRARTCFSEHAQCLALLEDVLPPDRRQRCFDALLSAPDLARTTVYFSFYLFETHQRFGRGDLFLERLGFWSGMLSRGLRTPVEEPEPSRSDCHAWGSHPLYHCFATLAGLRPDAPGFRRIRVEPSPGGLSALRVGIPHPRGRVEMEVCFGDDGDRGTICLPDGLEGVYRRRGREIALHPGENKL